ncbi:MAG TPA: hypothetical protein V6C97_15960 [Oculatellaceae cyanobacterium]
MSEKGTDYFYKQGRDVAKMAESGSLDKANQEIHSICTKEHLKPAEYHALLQSIRGANTMDRLDDNQRVTDYNKNKWFFQKEATLTVPNLIIDDKDKENPIQGYIRIDGTTQPAQPNKSAEVPGKSNPKAGGEGPVLPWNADIANKIFDDTLNTPKR